MGHLTLPQSASGQVWEAPRVRPGARSLKVAVRPSCSGDSRGVLVGIGYELGMGQGPAARVGSRESISALRFAGHHMLLV